MDTDDTAQRDPVRLLTACHGHDTYYLFGLLLAVTFASMAALDRNSTLAVVLAAFAASVFGRTIGRIFSFSLLIHFFISVVVGWTGIAAFCIWNAYPSLPKTTGAWLTGLGWCLLYAIIAATLIETIAWASGRLMSQIGIHQLLVFGRWFESGSLCKPLRGAG